MSRSCHSATFSRPPAALPRSTRASPVICSVLIGLRLWGIAEEPFCPARNGSCTSRTSVRCRWRISVREALQAGARRARSRSAARRGGRARRPAWRRPRARGRGARARAPRTRARSPRRCRRRPTARPPPPARRPRAAAAVAVRLEREAGELHAEGRRLGVHAVRAPDAQRALVLARPRCERRDELVGARRARPRRPPAAAARARCRARPRRSARSGSSARPRRPRRRARRRRPPRRGR